MYVAAHLAKQAGVAEGVSSVDMTPQVCSSHKLHVRRHQLYRKPVNDIRLTLETPDALRAR